MYSEFFGLKQSPFNNTPDPRFFFNTPDHEEAVASLVYAAQERKGFALLTGEVGSGKTLVSRLVLSRLERSAKFAVVHNTRVSPRELLFSICREFDVRVAADASAPEMSRALEEFLLDQYARDRLAVVIVDEAQHLTTESFEELRLLGNLEADDAKLLSVLILGQPELQAAFRLPEMQQLQQRLFRSYHLKALSRELTEGYIAHRLRIAGIQKAQTVFDRPALDAVYAASGGIPRLINQVCDAAMLAAYTCSTKKITEAIVEEVVEQCRPEFRTEFNRRSGHSEVRIPSSPHPVIRENPVHSSSAEEAVQFLERRVRDALEDCERARTSFEKALASTREEFTRTQNETVADAQAKRSIADEIEKSVESTNRECAAQIEQQRARIEALRSTLSVTADRAARQAVDLKAAAEQAKAEALADLQHARADFVVNVEQIKSSAAADLLAARTELDNRIAEATRLGLDIDGQSEGLAAQMAAAFQELRRGVHESLKESKQASDQSREQSATVLAQLRAAMEQINERTDTARRDLVELADQMNSGSSRCGEGLKATAEELLRQFDDRSDAARKDLQELSDQVKHGSVRSVEGLKSMVAELLQQIDDKTAGFRRETEHSCDRIGRLEHRFGEGVGSAKAAVQQIVDDARARFDAAQLQAGEMLVQAQAASAATHEQAAIALAEARGSAQRLREQLDQVVQRADAASENTRRELQDLRADLRKDRDQVREQIIESKSLLSDARQEAARIVEQARIESTRLIEMANATTSRLFEEAGRFERESQARAERIIHQTRETESRVDSLLRLPKEIIDEAGEKTATLAELSKSLTSVIAQLSAAGAAARAQNQEIAEASDLAGERLEGLRSHTARVGQLVGIIRQLYGIMDARIEGLRGRLDQAEHLCRTVPQEIDGLRSALGGDRNGHRVLEGVRSTPARRSRVKDAPQSTKGKAIILKSTGAMPTGQPSPGMLGDIVSRNRKLHEWLRQTLHESESNVENNPQHRIDPAVREIETQPASA